MQKQDFSHAFGQLKKADSEIVKKVILEKCKWSPQLWSLKKNGDRQLSKFSDKKINEILVVESTFRAFNLNAFTGETT